MQQVRAQRHDALAPGAGRPTPRRIPRRGRPASTALQPTRAAPRPPPGRPHAGPLPAVVQRGQRHLARPASRAASGTRTVTVAPSSASAPARRLVPQRASSVRVAGSPASDNWRSRAGPRLPRPSVQARGGSTPAAGAAFSGNWITASRWPARASRTTPWPAATTWPGSASINPPRHRRRRPSAPHSRPRCAPHRPAPAPRRAARAPTRRRRALPNHRPRRTRRPPTTRSR